MIGSGRTGVATRTARDQDEVPQGAAGPWPGFSITAPPAIAAAGNVGTALTAARGDHTHALDILSYKPSLAGMQAGGVLQQTYAAPTATPAVLTMVSGQVPFGAAAGGLLTQASTLIFNSATPAFAVCTTGTTVTPATIPSALIVGISEGAVSDTYQGYRFSATTGIPARTSMYRARGTFAAPLAVADNDLLGVYNMGGHNGTTFQNGVSHQAFIDTTFGPVANAELPAVWQLLHLTNTTTTGFVSLMAYGPVSTQAGGGTQQPGLVLGTATLGTADTTGFIFLVDTGGVPTGVPLVPRWRQSNNTRTAVTSIPTTFNSGNLRSYAFMGAAWHFSQFMDYDPGANVGRVPFVGATAHTLTDSALFTFNAGALTVGNGSGSGQIDLQQAGGGGTLASTTGDVFIAGKPGTTSTSSSVRLTAGVGVDSVRVYQDMVSFFGNGASSGVLTQNVVFFDNRPAMQGGQGTIFVHDRSAAPTGNPSNGGYMYSEAGALKWRGSAGTTTTVAPA